jgi:hypothetical protein
MPPSLIAWTRCSPRNLNSQRFSKSLFYLREGYPFPRIIKLPNGKTGVWNRIIIHDHAKIISLNMLSRHLNPHGRCYLQLSKAHPGRNQATQLQFSKWEWKHRKKGCQEGALPFIRFGDPKNVELHKAELYFLERGQRVASSRELNLFAVNLILVVIFAKLKTKEWKPERSRTKTT